MSQRMVGGDWAFSRPSNIPYEHALGRRGCHPGNKGSADSCLPVKELERLGGASRKELCERLGCTNDSDAALLDKLPEAEQKRLMKQYFRPLAPEEWKEDPDAWLDNFSINAVLKQYEQADPTFLSLGAVPIDFAAPDPYTGNGDKCLLPEFCRLNLADLRAKGKNGVGMVFNLDPHFKNGSHWVALYLDVEALAVYYFDSYGMKPPKQIRLLMETFWNQDHRVKMAYNGRRFQFSNSECGVYSIYFIICMHDGVDFKKFVKRRVKDEVMLFLRSWFFFVDDEDATNAAANANASLTKS